MTRKFVRLVLKLVMPNSCGQHHIGTIGLHGAAAKIGDKLVPHYVLMVGGADNGEAVHHATMIARIPAKSGRYH